MLSDFARDHAFTIAWFGLMTFVWCGWSQEDPPPTWRKWLGAASGLGLALCGVFLSGVIMNWDTPTALEGRYPIFGAAVGATVLLAGGGCAWLAWKKRSKWMAWWVAVVIGAHFFLLAPLFEDPGLLVLGVIQCASLALLYPTVDEAKHPSSREVGPVMGFTLLTFALVSSIVYLAEYGLPW